MGHGQQVACRPQRRPLSPGPRTEGGLAGPGPGEQPELPESGEPEDGLGSQSPSCRHLHMGPGLPAVSRAAPAWLSALTQPELTAHLPLLPLRHPALLWGRSHPQVLPLHWVSDLRSDLAQEGINAFLEDSVTLEFHSPWSGEQRAGLVHPLLCDLSNC